MQVFHSFNHSIAFGTQVKFGLLQLLTRRNAQASLRNPDLGWFEHTILTQGLGARQVWLANPQHGDGPLLDKIAGLSAKAGIPPPKKLLIYDHPDSNAAVLINGSMAISTGMLSKRLPERELNAVIGHELSHLKRYRRNIVLAVGSLLLSAGASIWSYLKVANFKKEKGWLRNIGRGAVATPVLPIVFKGTNYVTSIPLAAYVRHHEMVADRESAQLTGDPGAMADVLERLERDHHARPRQASMEYAAFQGGGSPAPKSSIWSEIKRGLEAPLKTHPPTYKRIAQLRAMERAQKGTERKKDRAQGDSYWRDQSPKQTTYREPHGAEAHAAHEYPSF